MSILADPTKEKKMKILYTKEGKKWSIECGTFTMQSNQMGGTTLTFLRDPDRQQVGNEPIGMVANVTEFWIDTYPTEETQDKPMLKEGFAPGFEPKPVEDEPAPLAKDVVIEQPKK